MSTASPVSPVAPDNRADLLAIAVAAALEAGDLLASREGRVAVAATKSSPTDVVTEMDGRAEELIRARILAARPDDAILGEEGGQVEGAADAPVRWVVDPLDGTVNYLYGLHDWAVSIAAEVDGEIVVGAVYAPMHGELFTAVRGEGAWLESSHRADSPGPRRPRAASARSSSPYSAGFRSAAGPACRLTGRSSRPASATRRSGGRRRARSWPRCCR